MHITPCIHHIPNEVIFQFNLLYCSLINIILTRTIINIIAHTQIYMINTVTQNYFSLTSSSL